MYCLHQAEAYIKQIVEQTGASGYMQEFLKQGRDKAAVTDVAEKLKQFSENMSLLQPIVIKGFMVPSGSLMLYHSLKEELDVVEKMLGEDGTGQNPQPKEKANRHAGKHEAAAAASAYKMEKKQKREPEALPSEQKEELRKRVAIVRRRLAEMTESLLSQHIADQIGQRTDEAAAQATFREHGYLPLYVDEKTMGIVYNTLTMQLLLDRFNLIFEGVFAPMDQTAVNSIVANVLAPYWKQHAQSILFTLEEG